MISNTEVTEFDDVAGGMGLFERYLSVWVALAIVAGGSAGSTMYS